MLLQKKLHMRSHVHKRSEPGKKPNLTPSRLSEHAQGFQKSKVFKIVVPLALQRLTPISVPSPIFHIKDNPNIFLYHV